MILSLFFLLTPLSWQNHQPKVIVVVKKKRKMGLGLFEVAREFENWLFWVSKPNSFLCAWFLIDFLFSYYFQIFVYLSPLLTWKTSFKIQTKQNKSLSPLEFSRGEILLSSSLTSGPDSFLPIILCTKYIYILEVLFIVLALDVWCLYVLIK